MNGWPLHKWSEAARWFQQKLSPGYRGHADFILLLILFVTFRVLALAAYRPGGLVLDFSDFYWYREFAELTRQGYYPYQNLWTTYPPLFPAVMIAIYQVSALLPPWEFANLWFTLLLGGFFLLFEIGNFSLLYLFALKLQPITAASHEALRPCWIYAAMFIPVYTLTGWFESYPLFFFLLSLYLILQNRPYLSSLFTGLGFMIKLTPVILIPLAVQRLVRRHCRLTFELSSMIPFDLPRLAVYLAIFLITVLIIAAPFYWLNPKLIFGPQQITNQRLPWETVWALIEGNYDYGVIPLDMRNLDWAADEAAPGRLPWLWVTAIFGVVYLFFYTRPLDWSLDLNMVAFAGFTLCLFMLWSKGYSPQWLNWPLFFTALLLPNLRGVTYTVILSLANIIEANFYFVMFPEQHWLLAATVLIRTFLFIVLAVEFLGLIWPQRVTPRLEVIRAWGVAIFVVALVIGAIPAGLALSRSYFELRRQQSPYSAVITRLQREEVTGALLLNSHTVYDWFYPYLRDRYHFFMLDDYAPPSGSVETQTLALLESIAQQTDVLWIYDADATVTTPAEEVLLAWLKGRSPAHLQDIDEGRLYLFILKPGS